MVINQSADSAVGGKGYAVCTSLVRNSIACTVIMQAMSSELAKYGTH